MDRLLFGELPDVPGCPFLMDPGHDLKPCNVCTVLGTPEMGGPEAGDVPTRLRRRFGKELAEVVGDALADAALQRMVAKRQAAKAAAELTGWRVLAVYDIEGDLVSREVVPAGYLISDDADDFPLLAEEIWETKAEALAALMQGIHP